jgi:acyl-CoA thioesterase FadM
VLLLVRFVYTILKSRFRPRIGPLGESMTHFTVLPQDCDLNFHLNAGRFISFMDIARIELIGRMRALSKLLRRGWRPVVGGCVVRFRRSVQPFERFQIRSRVVGWDEKWFYIEHILEKNGVLCAVGHMRTTIRGKNGAVPTRDVLALMGNEQVAQPPLPDFVAHWRDLEDAR